MVLHRRSVRQRCLVLAALTLMVSATWPQNVRADTAQQQLQNAQNQQEGITQQIKNMQGDIDGVDEQLQQTQDRLTQAQADHTHLLAQFNQLAAQRIQAEQEADKAEAALQALIKRLDGQKELLGNRLRSVQEKGRVSYLEVLFQSTSMQDLIGRWDLMASIVRHDGTVLKAVEAAQIEADKQRQTLVARRDQAAEMARQAEVRNNEAARRKNEVAALQNSFQAQREAIVTRLAGLEAANERMTAVVRDLEREVARKVGHLGMRFPVDRVQVTDDYGPRWHPILNAPRIHYGVDFAVDMGTPIYATEDGTVIVAGDQGAFGLAVIVSHGELRGQTVSTMYGHNSELLVWSGKTVKKGEMIAKAGSTGWSTGPHCHFEVRVNGSPVSPWDWLPSPA